ncbi:MAG: cyclic nucleotide-binding domain-containing protein [Gammaproteobacteria bacterium]|nr:cyclic nucleotide-binding domain-containing protein [Gammaproteobacteria bacterium]
MSKKITSKDLSNYQPLNTLNSESLREICNKLVIIEINKGDNIFLQGDAKADHIFLHEGEVDLVENGKVVKTLKAGTEDTKTALAHIIPRNFSAVAKSNSVAFMIDSDLLDMMLTWDQTGSFQVEELNAEEDDDWMSRILNTEAFRRIPPANIQAIFTSLEDIEVKPGDVIIKQGDPGDYFYIVKSGRCMVTRRMPGQDKDIKLAELEAGTSFGEEALISDAERNATIVMLTKGVLSRLSKEQFLSLLNEPMLDLINFDTAKEKVTNDGAEWLDVRLPNEYQSAHIKGATHLPLIFLRMKMNTLDKSKNYILYCDTGRRSSSASYILNERGFTTSILENGLKNVDLKELEGNDIIAD